MIQIANQQKLVFAWGVGISGMRTDSCFSGVSTECLIKKHSPQSEILCNSGCTCHERCNSGSSATWVEENG